MIPDERQASVDEIEVTEEMIRAGAEVIFQHALYEGSLSLAEDIAIEVYVAMLRVKRMLNTPPKPHKAPAPKRQAGEPESHGPKDNQK